MKNLLLAAAAAFALSTSAFAQSAPALPTVNYVGKPCSNVTTGNKMVVFHSVLPNGSWRVREFDPKEGARGYVKHNSATGQPTTLLTYPKNCIYFVPSRPSPTGR